MHRTTYTTNEQLIAGKMHDLAAHVPIGNLECIKRIQLNFLCNSLIGEKPSLQANFVDTCLDICSVMECNYIIEHSLNLLNEQKAIIAIANHFGVNKLTKITEEEIRNCIQSKVCSGSTHDDLTLTNDDPFIFLFSSAVGFMNSVINNNESHFSIVSMEYVQPFSKLVRLTGGIVVPEKSPRKYENIREEAKAIIESSIEEGKTPIFIIFPEGGTSGKRNEGSPYSLTEFKNGYSRLSFDLNIPVIRLITYFDQFSKLTVRSLGVIKCNLHHMPKNDRGLMQMELLRYAA